MILTLHRLFIKRCFEIAYSSLKFFPKDQAKQIVYNSDFSSVIFYTLYKNIIQQLRTSTHTVRTRHDVVSTSVRRHLTL